MAGIPHDGSWESSLAFLRDPYRFISRRCRRLGSDVFRTRLLFQNTICMTGREAAEVFCDLEKFIRRNASPGRVEKALFGVGGVQGLDDLAHRHRKAMLLSIVAPERVALLRELAAGFWTQALEQWTKREDIVLYDEVSEVILRAVCIWAGVPLREQDVRQRSREIRSLFDMGMIVGPGYWRARWIRPRLEAWAGDVIDQVRSEQLVVPESSAAAIIAFHRDHNGHPLSRKVAAVELLSIIRPTVAVGVFITFVAHALHEHPEVRDRLGQGEPGFVDHFVQEVRRVYPFFPATAARVRNDFSWRGFSFPAGMRVLLDLYGTNHDARIWDDPDRFLPDRFRHRPESLFDLIPQGAGDARVNHRCPGEGIARELMAMAAEMLVRNMHYQVPSQDLTLEFHRLPALPRSRMVLSRVQAAVPQLA